MYLEEWKQCSKQCRRVLAQGRLTGITYTEPVKGANVNAVVWYMRRGRPLSEHSS